MKRSRPVWRGVILSAAVLQAERKPALSDPESNAGESNGDLARIATTFKGPELLILWALRIYLLFMMAVIAYQVWIAAH